MATSNVLDLDASDVLDLDQSGSQPRKAGVYPQFGSEAESWRALGVPPEVEAETGLPGRAQRSLPDQEQITSPFQIPGAIARHNPGVAVGVPTAAAAIATGGGSLAAQSLIPAAVSSGAEALRQYLAGEPQQPGRTVTTGVMTALPAFLGRIPGALFPKIAKTTAGFPEAMQRTIRPQAEELAASMPAPSSKPLRDMLQRYWEGDNSAFPAATTFDFGGQGAETISMTPVLQTAQKLKPQLSPVIQNLSKTSGMEGIASELEKVLNVSPDMTPQQVDRLLKDTRLLMERLRGQGGETYGAVSQLYGSMKQSLEASTGPQATALAQARSQEARGAVVGDIQKSLTVPPGQRTPKFPQVVKTVPRTGTQTAGGTIEELRQYNPSTLLNELNNPQSNVTQRLAKQLSPEEMTSLKTRLQEWSQYPAVGGGQPGFTERMLPYALLGGVGGALGFERGGHTLTGAGVGAVGGLLAAELGGLTLKELAQTPAGQQLLRKMFLAGRQGTGLGTTALQSAAPELAQYLKR